LDDIQALGKNWMVLVGELIINFVCWSVGWLVGLWHLSIAPPRFDKGQYVLYEYVIVYFDQLMPVNYIWKILWLLRDSKI
jgi:hypothetical protein